MLVQVGKESIVLGVDLEVGLGMGAGGAEVGSLGANHDVAAVAALPHLDLTLGKDSGGFHIVQQRAVALLVVLLNGGDQTELGGQLGEALGLGGLGEALVHIRPLVVLAIGGSGQVLGGGADALQLLINKLGGWSL